MKKHVVGLIALIGLVFAVAMLFMFRRSHSATECNGAQYHVDFDVSLQKDAYPRRFESPVERGFYQAFRLLYDRNNLTKVTWSEKPRVPNIIHQIWIGSPFPEKYRRFQESWKKYNPDWEYRLWTDKELENLPMQNRDLYDASCNYGEKSDIARYEILYQFGGLYVDTDFECLRSFDLFNHCYDFYTGIQPLDTNLMQLGFGLIGVVPGHPVLKCCLDSLHASAAQTQQIIARTGPIFFTRVFEAVAPYLGDCTIAFPPSYFYPRGYTQPEEPRSAWLKPESFAVHQWEGSWMKKEAFVKR